jgi:CRISPR-associated exonuclease Cas4
MFTEDELQSISALQHLAFCERQWGLIHIEGLWDENRLTVEGRHLHRRADEGEAEVRGDVRIVRGLRLRSLRLGLSGKADVVEFHRIADAQLGPSGMRLDGVPGLWQPVPVEYKRGRPKKDHCDKVQLCAQALCIEEMTAVEVPRGFLYYGVPRRRFDVVFDKTLRKQTEVLCVRLHELSKELRTPPAKYGKRCKNCSLESSCMPKTVGRKKKVERYLMAAFVEDIDERKDI